MELDPRRLRKLWLRQQNEYSEVISRCGWRKSERDVMMELLGFDEQKDNVAKNTTDWGDQAKTSCEIGSVLIISPSTRSVDFWEIIEE